MIFINCHDKTRFYIEKLKKINRNDKFIKQR